MSKEIGYITKELKDLACDTMQKATEKILALKKENLELRREVTILQDNLEDLKRKFSYYKSKTFEDKCN